MRDVASTLERLGFHVTRVPDPGIEGFNAALLEFKKTAKGAQVVLVYYSGHGIEHEDINYLLPVDVTLDSAAQLRSQAVQVDTLLTDLKATGAPARTVILDCCRDNPFGAVVKSWRPPTKSAVDGNVLRALGEVEIPEATMVVFASSSGRKAAARLNGDSTHSPFTAAFLEFIQIPGLSLRDIFDKVEDAVSEATGQRQTPVVKYGGSSRVFRDMVFLLGGPAVKRPHQAPQPLPPPRRPKPRLSSTASAWNLSLRARGGCFSAARKPGCGTSGLLRRKKPMSPSPQHRRTWKATPWKGKGMMTILALSLKRQGEPGRTRTLSRGRIIPWCVFP